MGNSCASRGSARTICLAVVAAALTVALTATAQAQEDPYATTEETAKTYDTDTDLTPVAKEGDFFGLLHGAEFGETEVIEDSVTRFDTDLFTVSFRNKSLGLAGGSACAVEPVQGADEEEAEFGERVAACEGTDGSSVPRVPALYRYDEPPDDDPGWDRITLPGSPTPGYIGAIAWPTPDTALIVGGTGTYPRREGEPTDLPSSDPQRPDEAGTARAWLYHRATASTRERVEEIELSELTADTPASGEEPARAGMRGFTAVGCYQDPTPGRRYVSPSWVPDSNPDIEFCLAGALGQIWEWRVGDFTGERVDAQSSPSKLESSMPAGSAQRNLDQPELLRFRVRDIAFQTQNSSAGDDDPPQAVAVTAGCCATDSQLNVARRLDYNYGQDRWTSKRLHDAPEVPDSAYSLTMTRSSSSVIASAGGRQEPGERPSVIASGGGSGVNWTFGAGAYVPLVGTSAAGTQLSTARLVAGDGDVAGAGGSVGANGIPDWAVGELRSTQMPGLGARGLLVATALPPTAQDALNEGRGTRAPNAEEIAQGEYQPFDQEKLDAHIRASHYFLPSYSANAIDMLDAENDGWAVGDHGAIMRFNSAKAGAAEAAAEPKPPRLGQPRPDRLSDRGPYDDGKSLPQRAGTVPAISAETTELPEPRLVPGGEARGVAVEIIMSRDGSEGWALSNDRGLPVFTYYDGVRWSECDPLGVEEVSEPDPACEAMAPLITNVNTDGNARPLQINFATRVPLENDPIPTNDNELEIVAFVVNSTDGLHRMLRYRDGRWDFEDPDHLTGKPQQVQSMAFTGPDDGWALARANVCPPPPFSCGTAAENGDRLYHFNGEQWFNCQSELERCGNQGKRAPDFPDGAAGRLAVAGDRVYLYGAREVGGAAQLGVADPAKLAPLILYKDPDGSWTDGSEPGEDGAGLDPWFHDPATEESGAVQSLAVAESPGGGYEGWAFGQFSRGAPTGPPPPADAALRRLDPARGEGWRRFRSPGAYEDYMLDEPLQKPPGTSPRLLVGYPSAAAPDGTFVGQLLRGVPESGHRLFGFDSSRQRFKLIESGHPEGGVAGLGGDAHPAWNPQIMAPDGRGGFWLAANQRLLHYTTQAPKPVFEDAPDPLGTRGAELRDIAGGSDGSVWVATNSDRLYRYDRLSGWEEARIPGWDPGRVVTRPSQANAIAVGPGGEGVVVGEGGRIANLSPEAVQLDPAAGRSCVIDPTPPCSTSRDLNAVDIAPDGSAIAAGNRMALLWRGPGGEFARARGESPPIGSSTAITHVSYPTATRAYLATDAGVIFRGEMSSPGVWRWTRDNVDSKGNLVTTSQESGGTLTIRDLAVDASGHGYAVGSEIYERAGDGEWTKLAGGQSGTAVELSPNGEGVLVGGAAGRVLTGSGSELQTAHHADPSGATGPVAAIAYLPGSTEGSVDAWAGIGSEGPPEGDSRLLRYRSDPADPELEPAATARELPDAPEKTDGELTLAAFGKSECSGPDSYICTEMTGTTNTNELILERTIDELDALRERGELDLAVMSGDAIDGAGRHTSSVGNYDELGFANSNIWMREATWIGQLKHRRYSELVADELDDRGVPFFAAIGGQDLSEGFACTSPESCPSTKQFANAGESYAWREGFAGRAEPWGDGSHASEAQESGEIEIVAAEGSEDNSLQIDDQSIDADGEEGAVPEAKTEIGGASTHYALDAIRDGEAIARIVFVDTSLGALAATDPLQQPHELAGGQQRFLERMICRQGDTTTTAIDECTREPDQKAIVVSNTPSYSYGPGALSHTAKDANVFETLMLKHRVDLVVSGALGYNGLYYTLAPGIHEPCPGGSYPEAPPSGRTPDCLAGPTGPADAATANAPADAPEPASLIAEQGLAGAVPTLIASGAGGKFGPDGNLPADGPAGQWHGYTLARFLPSGDLVVEQRPILDWIGIDAPDHAVAPKSRLKLHGHGRSPLSTGSTTRALHYEISTPAITHRYDLVLADPDEPWRPCAESDPSCRALHANLSGGPGATGSTEPVAEASPCSPYLCLPSRIGTVDSQSGQVRAGDGKYPETYAIALLSVKDEVAAYPLTFKRSPAFVTSPAIRTGILPKTSDARTSPPPPPPPPPGLPQIPQVEIPQIPPPPGIPQLTAAAPPELQPPAPPAPPPPSQQPAPLDLSVAPPGVSISTPTALIQPPTPPVNPAPPGGARREARQRQAAAQKGGADSDASETQENGGDMAQGPPSSNSAAFTRHQRSQPEPSFTTLAAEDHPSAWSRGALYGGGLTLGAMILAFSWATLRPTPRRRPPEVPAPAHARQVWRRR